MSGIKLIKIISISFLIILLSVISYGCSSSRDSELEIYFYNEGNINTPVSVGCNEIYGYNGLRRIALNNRTYIDSISLLLLNFSKTGRKEIDVRFKLIIPNDTICMDYFGDIIHKGGIKTDTNKVLFNYVNSIITRHRKEAQKRKGDELPKPLRDIIEKDN